VGLDAIRPTLMRRLMENSTTSGVRSLYGLAFWICGEFIVMDLWFSCGCFLKAWAGSRDIRR
jgi:hypothetical protein